MGASYSIRQDLAWVEALEGGRVDRTVWIADVETGEHFSLSGTGWLIWILLDEGATTLVGLRAAAAANGVDDAFELADLPAFLDDLVSHGLLVRTDRTQDAPSP